MISFVIINASMALVSEHTGSYQMNLRRTKLYFAYACLVMVFLTIFMEYGIHES